MKSRNADLCILFGLVFWGILLYAFAFQSKFFHYDDKLAIEYNDVIRTINVRDIFDAFNTRFLVGFSFALNFFFNGLHPWGYRFVNVLIHALTAFLVYRLTRATLNLPPVSKSVQPQAVPWMSFFASMLFLSHPMQTEPINFITQRYVLMGALFYILTLVLYIEWRCHQQYLVGSMAAALAAMFCKEFTVTLPFMLALYEFCFLGFLNNGIWKRCKCLMPYFLIILIVPVMLLRTSPETSGSASIADYTVVRDADGHGEIKSVDITRAQNGLGRKDYFLTELNVVCTYVRLLVAPINQNADYDYPVSHRLDRKTCFCGLFLFLLLVLAVSAYRRQPMVCFCILWFFLSLSVESSFIPIGHVIAEYRVYLASAGFMILVAYLLYTRLPSIKAANAAAFAVIVVLSALTVYRNYIWADQVRLWQDVVKKSPLKTRPYGNLSGSYIVEGRYPQAVSAATQALRLDPSYAPAYYNICDAYRREGQSQKALAACEKAINLEPRNTAYRQLLGFVYVDKGDMVHGLEDFGEAFRMQPSLENATLYSKAIIYYYTFKKDREAALKYVSLLEDYKFSAIADYLRQRIAS